MYAAADLFFRDVGACVGVLTAGPNIARVFFPLVVTSHRSARSGRLAHFEGMGKGPTLRNRARTERKPNGNGSMIEMVARDRIELPTRGFSVT